MKKIILILLATLLLSACKKTNQNKENSTKVKSTENGEILNKDDEHSLSVLSQDDFSLSDDNSLLQNNSKNISEQLLLSSSGMLRLFSLDKEQFSLQGEKSRQSVHYADGLAIRKFFDESSRLQKKEIWKIGNTVESSKKESEEFFYYNENSALPFLSIEKKENERLESNYTEEGLIKNRKHYKIDEEKNDVLVLESKWEYNEQKKIIEEVHRSFFNLENDADFKKEKSESLEKKMCYEYDKDENLLNYTYYEDEVLRVKTEYATEDTYSTFLYFDNNYEIEAVYVDGKKTKETFFLQGKIIRVREYE